MVRAILLSAILSVLCVDATYAEDAKAEEAYTQAITRRAEKIIVRKIHDARDATVAELRSQPADDQAAADQAIDAVNRQAEIDMFALHRRFIAQLSVELTAGQVEQVKDGMTYGVVPITYSRYLELLPDLSEAEKKTVKALLVEAREYAMDAGSSTEKHHWFGKYKGKINNFLSAAGYNLKEAEKQAQLRNKKAHKQ